MYVNRRGLKQKRDPRRLQSTQGAECWSLGYNSSLSGQKRGRPLSSAAHRRAPAAYLDHIYDTNVLKPHFRIANGTL